ncbi:hypothetical protein HY224_02095 [Candidatus Uhrbacteria bacterium]|nr:hypothetical protein [Candidatus Uhrbacteria bacterium]
MNARNVRALSFGFKGGHMGIYIMVGVLLFFLVISRPRVMAWLEMAFGVPEEHNPTDTGEQISHTGELLTSRPPNTGRARGEKRPTRKESRPSRPSRDEVLASSSGER